MAPRVDMPHVPTMPKPDARSLATVSKQSKRLFDCAVRCEISASAKPDRQEQRDQSTIQNGPNMLSPIGRGIFNYMFSQCMVHSGSGLARVGRGGRGQGSSLKASQLAKTEI